MKTAKNQIGDTLHINLEETSMMGEYMKGGNKSANKTLIKIISSKFHDLYLKLINQMKHLKIENSNLKKRIRAGSNVVLGESPKISSQQVTEPENMETIMTKNNLIETENESLKYLLHEEMECFNQILFDFNIQFNDLQSQEESLRRDILKKHKEIEKLNGDIDECKKQKDSFIKELQNIALKLNEYKAILPTQINQNTHHTNHGRESHLSTRNKTNPTNSNHDTFKANNCEKCDSHNKDDEQNESQAEINKSIESLNNYDDDMADNEDFYLLMNSDNKEYLIRKIIQENKKYKDIVKAMKSEEAEFNNYLYQLEAEIENFSKFKNFSLTKISKIEENILNCREKIDNFSNKVNNIEFQLEIAEDI
jgi:chromosome segregation ATPase